MLDFCLNSWKIQIHENLLFWLGTGTLKSGGVIIVVWAKNSLKHI
jgi:hypothetical protein